MTLSTETVSGERLDEMLDRIKSASVADRMYERPLQWADAEVILTELKARRALSPSHGEAVALYGPYGWLNGHRGLSEDSWAIEGDPLENNEEYFAIPLFAKVDPFIEVGKLIRPALSPDSLPLGGVKALPGDLRDGWLIHKAGRGWYRPDAQGYTNDPAQAGRYTRDDADAYSHPNGLDGPRDEITIRHESNLPALKPIEPERISEAMVERFKAEFAKGRGLMMPSSEFVRRCLSAALNGAVK